MYRTCSTWCYIIQQQYRIILATISYSINAHPAHVNGHKTRQTLECTHFVYLVYLVRSCGIITSAQKRSYVRRSAGPIFTRTYRYCCEALLKVCVLSYSISISGITTRSFSLRFSLFKPRNRHSRQVIPGAYELALYTSIPGRLLLVITAEKSREVAKSELDRRCKNTTSSTNILVRVGPVTSHQCQQRRFIYYLVAPAVLSAYQAARDCVVASGEQVLGSD